MSHDKQFLAPCPFCGNEEIESGEYWSGCDWYVRCPDCGGMVIVEKGLGEKENQAVTRWNSRK